jgi:hypothetical protein
MKSPYAKIVDSGYELTPKPKGKRKCLSFQFYANAKFEPWNGNGEFVGAERWQTAGQMARLAYAIMHRTREELVETDAKISQEVQEDLWVDLKAEAEYLKSVVAMLDEAHFRTLAAAHINHAKSGKSKKAGPLTPAEHSA